MCGIVAVVGTGAEQLAAAMSDCIRHRGPDARGLWTDPAAEVALAHRRLSIVDLSEAGRQPMVSADDRYAMVFNGEVYNYRELRSELADYPYRSQTDSEVVLAAWARWGEACLDRLIGMFAFAIWDRRERSLVGVRDRFGVKPLLHARTRDGGLALASEIKAFRAAGLATEPDPTAWATYLASGISDHSPRTFWRGVEAVPAGCLLRWKPGATPQLVRWYDLPARIGVELDTRPATTVADEYLELLRDSVKLRFRSDVPVGVNLSGGLDSSLLLGIIQSVQGADSDVKAFTFVTGDEAYDELPWVRLMLEHTRHPLVPSLLTAAEVPALAEQISRAVDEPYGGIPTLAYAKIFQRAREEGVIVLLDGQGLDEQWAGYDYYRRADSTRPAPTVQGSVDSAIRPDCLRPEFAALGERVATPTRFGDPLRDLQLRDLTLTKIPRALRYNDRVSMAASTELREPFLDHRLVELAFRQPRERKIVGDTGKVLLRELATRVVPDPLRTAPKRPVQTPQREWLRGPLRAWAGERIDAALERVDWFAPNARDAWQEYLAGHGDNSHWVWQWISIAMVLAA